MQRTSKIILVFFLAIFLINGSQAAEANSPVKWTGYAIGEDVSNFKGGLKRGSIFTVVGHLLGTYDTELGNLWKNGAFSMGVLAIGQTHNQALYTNAVQTPSNYSAVPEIRISDLAYQHKFSKIATVKVGIMDIDDHFNVLANASNILNSALDNTISLSSNTQLATYPYPGFGVVGLFGTNLLGIQLAVFQAQPQHQSTVFRKGQMYLGELSSDFGTGVGDAPKYTLKGGLWKYKPHGLALTAPTSGLYAIAETTWKTNSGLNLGVGLNVGTNPRANNLIKSSAAACLTASNLFSSRPKDSINLAIGRANINGHKSEMFYEVNYVVQISDKIALVPDLQYVVKPSGVSPNAWVGILRLSYTVE
jgi:porin